MGSTDSAEPTDRGSVDRITPPSLDRVFSAVVTALRYEPVSTSVALGLVAAAITDSMTGFALAALVAWFVAVNNRHDRSYDAR
jgi:hypothetical protein